MAKRVRISDLREPITVRNPVKTDQGGGSSTTAYPDQASVRGRVAPLSGREIQQGRQVQGHTPYEVTLRWPLPGNTNVTSRTRFVWSSPTGSRTLEAAAPPQWDRRRRFVHVLCTEKEAL